MTSADHQQGPPAPAGWYPEGVNGQRYWDGSAWTEHRAPAAAAVQMPARHGKGLATAGFVLALVGVPLALIPVIGFLLGGAPALVAVILSIVASQRGGGGGGGKNLVTFGILIGAVTLIAICFAGMGTRW